MSRGLSIAKALKVHSEQGGVFKPSSVLLQPIHKNGQHKYIFVTVNVVCCINNIHFFCLRS